MSLVLGTEPTIARAGAGLYRLTTPMQALWNPAPSVMVEWMVPAGFVTDGASVPPIFWPVVGHPLSPSSLRAAILHDWMCRYRTYSDRFAANVFYEALRADGCAWLRSRLMWLAVRWFGPRFTAVA